MSYHSVILLTYRSTLLPLIYVSAMAIFLMGDSNLGTPMFTWMYVSSSFMKASACCLSPSKICGGEPITCILGFAGIGTRCAIRTGAGAPPPGPLGPPPVGGPGPVQHRAASKASLRS